MNEPQDKQESNNNGLNLAHFSPSVNDIVRFFSGVMKNLKAHAGKRDSISSNSFESKSKGREDIIDFPKLIF